jgi:phage-related protein
MSPRDKPLVWLRGEIKTPPFCHERRIVDAKVTWRIIYYIATDAVVILDVFKKQTETTPNAVIAACQRRLKEFRRLSGTRKDSGHAQR